MKELVLIIPMSLGDLNIKFITSSPMKNYYKKFFNEEKIILRLQHLYIISI